MILFAITWALAFQSGTENPIVHAWLVNPAAQSAANPSLRAVLPEVQSVRVEGDFVAVESAGLSLQSLAPLDANDRVPAPGPRKFVFRFPLEPRPAGLACSQTPLDVVGAFLNGVPLYNPTSPVSYHDQNIWHLDAVASLSRQSTAPALGSLLIGFALDGYPIYGASGFRSSYRLRKITRRASLPDGTELNPSQEGPPVNAEFPLGAFVEDYEYVPGSGDLDEHNGRIVNGSYAYFLSTYPYLVGPSYYGYVEPRVSSAGVAPHAPLDADQARQIDLTTPVALQAGEPAALTFSIRDVHGRRVRFLEKVHQQPIHLVAVSTDLAEFAHIHPEIQPDDTYAVSYTFPHGGTYWLYADYTIPGATQSISRFRLDVKGDLRPLEKPRPDNTFTKMQDGLEVKLTTPAEMRAGQDLTFRFDLSATDLQPYLGAWAHIMIVSGDRQEFIHAHPLDNFADSSPWQHTHAAPGPSPSTISTITGFRHPGLYRLWVQFQRQGKVITFPYTFQVKAAEQKAIPATRIPADAIRVRVSSAGFEPARITIASGKPVVLAFERQDAQNCASSVVFPELGIRKLLPAGETLLVEIPASTARELHFACGMNMFRGSLLISDPDGRTPR